MPTGHLGHISLVVELMLKLQPRSVLDVGIGYGKYGMLAREYLDCAHFKKRSIVIDGIEGFPDYIQDGQRFYYDHIFIGDVRTLLPSVGQYEMILLMDILEHFDKEDGLKILKICQSKANYVLVATPLDIGIQGAVYDNEFERHRFQWKKQHLLAFSPIAFFKSPATLFALIGEGSTTIKKELALRKFKVLLRENFPLAYAIYKKIKG